MVYEDPLESASISPSRMLQPNSTLPLFHLTSEFSVFSLILLILLYSSPPFFRSLLGFSLFPLHNILHTVLRHLPPPATGPTPKQNLVSLSCLKIC